MDRRGTIEITTGHDAPHNLVTVVVADDGPGIPAGDRDKLFLPYYSTKQRGSGLGGQWGAASASAGSAELADPGAGGGVEHSGPAGGGVVGGVGDDDGE